MDTEYVHSLIRSEERQSGDQCACLGSGEKEKEEKQREAACLSSSELGDGHRLRQRMLRIDVEHVVVTSTT
jgi:hypothetical protein